MIEEASDCGPTVSSLASSTKSSAAASSLGSFELARHYSSVFQQLAAAAHAGQSATETEVVAELSDCAPLSRDEPANHNNSSNLGEGDEEEPRQQAAEYDEDGEESTAETRGLVENVTVAHSSRIDASGRLGGYAISSLIDTPGKFFS